MVRLTFGLLYVVSALMTLRGMIAQPGKTLGILVGFLVLMCVIDVALSIMKERIVDG